jgi:hypothetical protein
VVKKVVEYTGFSHIGNFDVSQAQTQATLKPRLSAIQMSWAKAETQVPQVHLFQPLEEQVLIHVGPPAFKNCGLLAASACYLQEDPALEQL